MKISICKGQVLGQCPNCKYDVDPQHHPNNFDCPKYKPFGFVMIDLINGYKPKEDKDDGNDKTPSVA